MPDKDYKKPRRYRNEYKYEKPYQPINNNSDVTNIYYDLTIMNNNTGYDNNGVPVQRLTAARCLFNQNRQMPYLNTPEDYNVSVVYLNLDSNSFPLHIVQPVVGQSSTTITNALSGISITGMPSVYSFTFSYNGVFYGPYEVVWTPNDTTLPLPTGVVTKSNITDEYYWNYYFQYFIDILNQNINIRISNITNSLSDIPFFSYNAETGLFYFNASTAWQTDENGNCLNAGDKYQFFLNPQLFELFGSIPNLYKVLTVQGVQYQLVVQTKPDLSNVFAMAHNINTYPAPTDNYIKVEGTWPTTQVWNPVVSVVFRARNLCVKNTLLGQPYVYGVNPNTETNNSGTDNILFELLLGRRANPTIYYEPSAEYFLTELIGLEEQTEMQIDTFWKDEFGVLHQFFIEVGSTLVMKILFRKKDFNH